MAIHRAIYRRAPRQRLANLYVANVPGPRTVMHVCGARVVELFPVVPITASMSVAVGMLSYAGQLGITVVADRDACPDAHLFAEGIARSLERLGCGVASAVTAPFQIASAAS